ncbi:Pentatricopeptide repeat [Dillenia turbinata]|uniref:Pentatricopeptide repeat n=1 Tax=Dillenia turbinata TaxID=194707 RepID=A0AAN8W205_9MAGN
MVVSAYANVGNFAASEVTLAGVLGSCSMVLDLFVSREINGWIVKCGFYGNVILESALADVYGKCGMMSDARRMFTEIERPNAVCWNEIVRRPMNFTLSNALVACSNIFALNEGMEIDGVALKMGLKGMTWCLLLSLACMSNVDIRRMPGRSLRNQSQGTDFWDDHGIGICNECEMNLVTIGVALNLCAGLSDIELGKQVHGYIYRHGYYYSRTVCNSVLDMRGKCGNLRSFKIWLFKRDSVSWDSLIPTYVQHQLSACANIFALKPGKQIHEFMLRNNNERKVVIKGGFVDMYTKCRNIDYALKSEHYGCIIELYITNGGIDALENFVKACRHPHRAWTQEVGKWSAELLNETNPPVPSHFEIMTNISWGWAYKRNFDNLHMASGYMKSGHGNKSFETFNMMPNINHFSWNVLISGFVKAGELGVARQLFNDMPRKNGIAWNSIIHGYTRAVHPLETLRLFKELSLNSVDSALVDTFVMATVVGACTDLGYLDCGKQVHACIVIRHVEFDSLLGSSLVNVYGKCGDLGSANQVLNMMVDPDNFSVSALISGYANCGRLSDARRVFDRKNNPCVEIWNSMIVGFVVNNEEQEALVLFDEMRRKGIHDDSSASVSILSAISGLGILENGKQLHTHAYKVGVLDDMIVAGALVDAYWKCGSPNDACKLFSELKGQNGLPMEALDLLCKMQNLDLGFDKFNRASAISACASMSSLAVGEQLFARATVVGLESDPVIFSSLIDLYCKLQNGYGVKALALFRDMQSAGVPITDITFTGVLSACDHCGLIEEGRRWFWALKSEYNIDPGIEHYCCVVDLFAHAGCIEEAVDLIEQMPFEADVSMWSSVLRGCIAHGDANLGKKVAQKIIEFNPYDSSAYVQLSTIYANSGDRERSTKSVRETLMAFKKLLAQGPQPDETTLLEVLLACNYGGFMDERSNIFSLMEKEYGVRPRDEHYVCIMDMMSRAGRLEEVFEIIRTMSYEPSSLVWGAILGDCGVHGDLRFPEMVAGLYRPSQFRSASAMGNILLPQLLRQVP